MENIKKGQNVFYSARIAENRFYLWSESNLISGMNNKHFDLHFKRDHFTLRCCCQFLKCFCSLYFNGEEKKKTHFVHTQINYLNSVLCIGFYLVENQSKGKMKHCCNLKIDFVSKTGHEHLFGEEKNSFGWVEPDSRLSLGNIHCVCDLVLNRRRNHHDSTAGQSLLSKTT